MPIHYLLKNDDLFESCRHVSKLAEIENQLNDIVVLRITLDDLLTEDHLVIRCQHLSSLHISKNEKVFNRANYKQYIKEQLMKSKLFNPKHNNICYLYFLNTILFMIEDETSRTAYEFTVFDQGIFDNILSAFYDIWNEYLIVQKYNHEELEKYSPSAILIKNINDNKVINIPNSVEFATVHIDCFIDLDAVVNLPPTINRVHIVFCNICSNIPIDSSDDNHLKDSIKTFLTNIKLPYGCKMYYHFSI